MVHRELRRRARPPRSSLTHELRFPHSLGLLYSAFTYYAGFKVNSAEYKVMGLAPYGEPRYLDRILEHLIDLRDDGSLPHEHALLRLLPGPHHDLARRSTQLFGGPPRDPDAPLTQREMDLAASIQAVTDEIMLRCGAPRAPGRRACATLCLAGGVALNCVSNGKLLREGPFDDVWVQPAAGDAGGALGVALPRLAPAARPAAHGAPA